MAALLRTDNSCFVGSVLHVFHAVLRGRTLAAPSPYGKASCLLLRSINMMASEGSVMPHAAFELAALLGMPVSVQHDAHEFFARVVEAIAREHRMCGFADTSPILAPFTALRYQLYTCTTCQTATRASLEVTTDVRVDINPQLTTSFSEYDLDTLLTKRCQACGLGAGDKDHTAGPYWVTLPEYLIVHLRRWDFVARSEGGGAVYKKNAQAMHSTATPVQLYTSPWVLNKLRNLDPADPDSHDGLLQRDAVEVEAARGALESSDRVIHNYGTICVVMHQGATEASGHYTVNRKLGKEWRSYNDGDMRVRTSHRKGGTGVPDASAKSYLLVLKRGNVENPNVVNVAAHNCCSSDCDHQAVPVLPSIVNAAPALPKPPPRPAVNLNGPCPATMTTKLFNAMRISPTSSTPDGFKKTTGKSGNNTWTCLTCAAWGDVTEKDKADIVKRTKLVLPSGANADTWATGEAVRSEQPPSALKKRFASHCATAGHKAAKLYVEGELSAAQNAPLEAESTLQAESEQSIANVPPTEDPDLKRYTPDQITAVRNHMVSAVSAILCGSS